MTITATTHPQYERSIVARAIVLSVALLVLVATLSWAAWQRNHASTSVGQIPTVTSVPAFVAPAAAARALAADVPVGVAEVRFVAPAAAVRALAADGSLG